MANCPRCDRTLPTNAIRCPQCNLTLVAHGHAGMPLHRAEGDIPLCATCTYDADDSCTFPKRPTAMTCTLYQDVSTPPPPTRQALHPIARKGKDGLRLAIAILIILVLVVISL